MTVRLLGPNGSSGVNLANPNNLEKTVDAGKLASTDQTGTDGSLFLRNKITDGAFDYWDATTQTTTGFLSDIMWHNDHLGTTKTHSRQSLTAGVDLPSIDCPRLQFYSRTVVTSVAGVNNFCRKYQAIEDVRTLAGKSAILSFYAKADATKTLGINLEQNFGTGGSPSAAVASISPQLVNLTTSWVRYSVPVVIPSISGKVLGTNADHRLFVAFWFDAGSAIAAPYGISTVGQKSGTYDITGVQLEEGTLASEFEDLHPTIAQQLVERHYQKIGGESQYDIILQCYATAGYYVSIEISLPTRLRAAPTKTKVGTWFVSNCNQPSTVPGSSTQTITLNIACTITGAVQFNTVDATTYIVLDARL